MTEVMPFSEAKARLSELADRVEDQHERIVVTRHGRPTFVLMSPDELESLEETLDILQDDELEASLRLSRQEAAEGQLIPLHEIIEAETSAASSGRTGELVTPWRDACRRGIATDKTHRERSVARGRDVPRHVAA
ncbi:type II toxin-antitoxin system Phd/YefM family antitoxin [Candidatus Poriferisodalis sp.]|uniref:type II toxin-antitoxin system Phd/YefM family antitoxin n=1 Tax=Candidatus Poriferisodalis sp. TaxID=3101277 RepID=UPI003C6F6354